MRHCPRATAWLCAFQLSSAISPHERMMLRDETMDMFRHGFDNYMRYAYPDDELKPLSCVGRRWDLRERGTLDDSLGGYALTLVDSLSTLAMLGDVRGFTDAVDVVVREITFDRDVTVSVFEANIRVLGGLLSAYVLATELRPRFGMEPQSREKLLEMARDLGERLLPAFDTPTGIPFHVINLRHGVSREVSQTRETCTAAAGTLLLELGLLSRLTGDSRFETGALPRSPPRLHARFAELVFPPPFRPLPARGRSRASRRECTLGAPQQARSHWQSDPHTSRPLVANTHGHRCRSG